MKVRIAFTVDIDPEAWVLEYGTDPSGVREDVQGWATHMVRSAMEDRGVGSPTN